MNHPPENYDWILAQFDNEDVIPIIVAGQAVNIWSSIYQDWDAQHNPHFPKIKDLLPLTSGDMELLDTGIIRVIEKFSGVMSVDKAEPFQHTHSPDLATIHLERDNETFKIQVMVSVLGATKEEIIRRAFTIKMGTGVTTSTVKIIDPITLLKCKIQNLLTLDQEKPTRRQDLKHIKLLMCVVRAHIGKSALDKSNDRATRDTLDIIRDLRNVTNTKNAAKLAEIHDINWTHCLPDELFRELSHNSNAWKNFIDHQQ